MFLWRRFTDEVEKVISLQTLPLLKAGCSCNVHTRPWAIGFSWSITETRKDHFQRLTNPTQFYYSKCPERLENVLFLLSRSLRLQFFSFSATWSFLFSSCRQTDTRLQKPMHPGTVLSMLFLPLSPKRLSTVTLLGFWIQNKCYCTFFWGTVQLLPQKRDRETTAAAVGRSESRELFHEPHLAN